jgi:hypothetical protein
MGGSVLGQQTREDRMERLRGTGAVKALIVTATMIVALGWVSAAHAVVIICQEKKLKAQGKLQACLKKNSANVLGGGTDLSTACQMKFGNALTKAGSECRFLDNGDGTVTDLNTGLQWEKKDNLDSTANPADPHDADNTYTLDGTAYTDFLAQLNNDASIDGTAITGCFAGHCDWRLPTSAELQAILLAPFPCATSPCIDPAFGPMQSDLYWSATTFAGNASNAWCVNFHNGLVDFVSKSSDAYARAVRGGL